MPVLKEGFLQQKEFIIDKAKLAPGIYFYHIISGEGKIVSGKLVVM